MDNFILQEAFQKLNMLNEEDFNISNNSEEGIDELKDFVDNDEEVDEIEIIDTDVEDEEELEDSYTDKVILDCSVCHSKIFKDVEEVSVDEEEDFANVGEECPYCYSSDGYKVIGQIKPFVETEVDVEVEPKDDDIEDIDDDIEDIDYEDDEEGIDEGLVGTAASVISAASAAKDLLSKNESLDEAWIKIETTSDKGALAKAKKTLKAAGIRITGEFDSDTLEEASNRLPKDDWTKVYDELTKSKNYGLDNVKAGTSDENSVVAYADSPEGLQKAKDIADKYGLEGREGHNGSSDPAYYYEIFTSKKKEDKKADESFSRERTGKFQESIEKLDIETEHDNIHVETEEKTEAGEEMIVPVEPEVEDEFMGVEDEVPLDEFSPDMEAEAPIEDDEYADYDLEDFDEESFDDLGESYLRNVYGNVESYKTTSAKVNGNSLVLEGVIKFNSGNEKDTQFIFESKDATKSGKVRFVGRNPQINESKKAFTLTGRFEGKQLFSESLKYSYRQKTDEGFKRVSGTAKLNG